MLNKFIINTSHLISNVLQIKTQNPNSLICAMVKANAYGIGLIKAVKTLSNHVEYFGVATAAEAYKAAKYTNKKILIVGALEKVKNVNNRFSYACHSLEDVKFLASFNKKINIHLKINTGMNRYGFCSKQELLLAMQQISNSKLNLEGVFTHFATADSYVDEQMKKFKAFVSIIKKQNFNPLIHVDNSLVNFKKNHHKAMVRIGFDLYNKNNFYFKSAVSIESQIVQVNYCKRGDLVGYNYNYIATSNIKVAVVPVGYADGFSTCFAGMDIIFKSKRCKVLNVCMDCFLLDITNVKTKIGDRISILDENNPLSAYAKYSKLSEYEIMCNFSHIRANRLISASNA